MQCEEWSSKKIYEIKFIYHAFKDHRKEVILMEVNGKMVLSNSDVEKLKKEVRPAVLEEFLAGEFHEEEVLKYLRRISSNTFFSILEKSIPVLKEKVEKDMFTDHLTKMKVTLISDVLNL